MLHQQGHEPWAQRLHFSGITALAAEPWPSNSAGRAAHRPPCPCRSRAWLFVVRNALHTRPLPTRFHHEARTTNNDARPPTKEPDNDQRTKEHFSQEDGIPYEQWLQSAGMGVHQAQNVLGVARKGPNMSQDHLGVARKWSKRSGVSSNIRQDLLGVARKRSKNSEKRSNFRQDLLGVAHKWSNRSGMWSNIPQNLLGVAWRLSNTSRKHR